MRHIGCHGMRASVGELCFARDGGDRNLASQDYPMSCVSLGRMVYSLYICYRCHLGNPSYPCYIFFIPLEVGHLKLHKDGDVNLSHSLGIVGECAGS
jgi:hypothetical protein